MNPSMSSARFVSALLFLTLIAYCLPWIVSPGAALSLGAYDLAEWTSLHPEVRGSNPALLTTLLLRLPLFCLGLLIALSSLPVQPAIRLMLTLVLSLALLPPLEFFTQASGDPNYQQQFVLSLITAIVGILLFVINIRKRRPLLLLVVALIALITGMGGILQSRALIIGFSLPAQPGLGAIIYVVSLIAIAVLAARSFMSPQSKQGSSLM